VFDEFFFLQAVLKPTWVLVFGAFSFTPDFVVHFSIVPPPSRGIFWGVVFLFPAGEFQPNFFFQKFFPESFIGGFNNKPFRFLAGKRGGGTAFFFFFFI